VEFDEDDPEAEAEAAEAKVGGSFPWSGSDRDYTYEELVGECVWGGGGGGGPGGGACVEQQQQQQQQRALQSRTGR
jgi:hypothetical protein